MTMHTMHLAHKSPTVATRIQGLGKAPTCIIRSRRIRASAATGGSGDFADNVKRIAKKIQGSLPVIGLLSRLAAPEGGFDEISYPEFTRAQLVKAPLQLKDTLVELERRHGKSSGSRFVFLVLWMVKYGVGLVPPKDILNAAKRLRVTQDLEIEMDRFENNKEAVLKKYNLMERPQPTEGNLANMAVDALGALCLGLKEGDTIPEAEVAPMAVIICEVLGVSEVLVREGVQSRQQRALTYT